MSRTPRRILLVGDVHDEVERLARALALIGGEKPDLAVLTGDVGRDPPWHRAQRRTHRGHHDASVRRVLSLVRTTCACPVAFVPGNHDLDDPPGDVEGTNVDGRIDSLAGIRVAGFGGAGPTPFGFAYEWSEAEAEAALARLFAGGPEIDLFVSHTPPARTEIDRTHDGDRVGSDAVRRWIARVRPKLFVAGHIHEAWGVDSVEGVPCINAGALGEPYGLDLVWLVDWRDGPERIRSLVGDGEGSVDLRDWPVRPGSP